MSQSSNRLPDGGRIDRTKPLAFTFNGKAYSGFQGDTLASALLANGVKVVGRSFKYHRPRAIVSAGMEEFNALVQLEPSAGAYKESSAGNGKEFGAFDEPNARATGVELYPGLNAKSQNCWPSVNVDAWGVVNKLSKFLPAGFYYKTFIWPNWHTWEDFVRRAAGLGTVPTKVDPSDYHKHNAHCDLLVVGGGPAGLAAALAAGNAGKRVILVDDQEEMGGSLLWEKQTINVAPATEWVAQTVDRQQQLENVQLLSRSHVFAYYDHNVLAALERVTDHLGPQDESHRFRSKNHKPRQRLWKIRAEKVVLATGAIERPLTFVNNDRPGIMLASAVRHYVNRYAVTPGKHAVVVTNNDSAYRTALDLADAGVEVVAVVDARANPQGALPEQVRARGIVIHAGKVVANVKGTKAVRAVQIAALSDDGKQLLAGRTTLNCDLVAMSGGWNPTVHLCSQSGGKLRYDDNTACFVPRLSVQNEQSVGACKGTFSLAAALREGFAAGDDAFEALSLLVEEQREEALYPLWQIPGQPASKQWLDFQYDVTVADVEMAARENFISVEHFKRYTGNGMSVDQGKTSNVSALAVLGEVTGRKIPEVGTTKFRPPYHPVSIGAIVGQSNGEYYHSRLEMPGHAWHVDNGAIFEDAGGWQRPSYYLRDGETPKQAITREVHAARNAAGLFEGSPLGKIEVRGKDAVEFLNRVYLNNMKTLKEGCVRYGLMLNENGVLIDDGVLAHLGENHYQVGTTSAGARRILLWMEEWLQCEWLDLDVRLTPVTTQWAVCTLTGPKAREVLRQLSCDIDLSAEAFPHMTVREGTLAGVPARIFRVSFTGELSYEINVPANYGLALWQALMDVGAEQGITAYGLEALEVLRTEKGYLHLGTDTDGTTCPADVGWGGPVAKKQTDFIGKRSLSRAHNVKSGRLEFVGLAAEGDEPMPMGAHLINAAQPDLPIETQGYVTSSYASPTLNKPVALGLLKNGQFRSGETVYAYDQGKVYTAKVVGPVFYDQQGERLNA